MKSGKRTIAVIFITIIGSLLIAIFGIGDGVKGITKIRYGIDIRGGVEAVFVADNGGEAPAKEDLKMARDVIEMRLDGLNITDREVVIDHKGGLLIVRFPWKSEEAEFSPEEAIAELGDMAKLTFRDSSGNVLLEGKNIRKSAVRQETSKISSSYVVTLQFDSEGDKLFEQATEKLIGQKMGIYMDEKQISNPFVENKISGGEAEITNISTYDEAKALSDKINSGALPFSMETKSFSTISPSMGNHALNIMIGAGVLAFIIVCMFMIIYYKLPGIVACITLFFQMILQLLAISAPQFTLTLPGIAGIILSLGMAVDANIIIAERILEERKKGHYLRTAVQNGYRNGVTSVLDGNITTAAIAVILMIFGSGTMLSFGYTLLVGTIINVVVGVTLSKKLLLALFTFKIWTNEKWFREKKALRVRSFYQKKYLCVVISGTVFIIGIAACFINGVRLDTQFTGGAVQSYSVTGNADLSTIEKRVEEKINRPVTVQETKSNLDDSKQLEITLAGTGGLSPEEQKLIMEIVKDGVANGAVTLKQTYTVEPYIGEKALYNAVIAIGLSCAFIVIYVWIRFAILSGLVAGITAMIALFHDTVIVFFAFVLFSIPLNDAFVAVILTIIGYSINDTIVVYDRIRENRKERAELGVIKLNDLSVSQVMARSINTSITTGICVVLMLLAAVIFQIDSIFKFSLPLLFGLVSGCYSSICIASILWTIWEKRKEKRGSKYEED